MKSCQPLRGCSKGRIVRSGKEEVEGRGVGIGIEALLYREESGAFGLDRSLAAVGDPASVKIVGAKFNGDFVARKNADKELSHPTGDVGKNNVAIIKFYTEHRIWKGFFNRPFHLNCIFFSQTRVPFFTKHRIYKNRGKQKRLDFLIDTMT